MALCRPIAFHLRRGGPTSPWHASEKLSFFSIQRRCLGTIPPSKDSDETTALVNSSPLTSWKDFAAHWNGVVTRQPVVVATLFMTAQSTTWLGLYTTFWATGVMLPPAAAAGWACARLTKRLQRPVDLVMAAGLYQKFPSLGDIRLSPLLAPVTDAHTKEQMRRGRLRVEETLPWTRPVFRHASRGWNWLQGPIDHYGLAFFLSSKVMYLTTMGVATVAVSRGMDVEAFLASWGIGAALGDAVGTVAGSAAVNVLFVPVHFLAVVHGVPALEGIVLKLIAELKRRENEEGRWDGSGGEKSEEYYEQKAKSYMELLTLPLLFWALTVTLYAVRKIGEAATTENETEREKQTQELADR